MPLPDTPYILSTDAWAFITSSNYADMRSKLLNSGTLTSDAPVTISQTWGTTGIYTAAKVNVTETATANSASRLLDLQVGGASLANFSKAGHLIFPSSSTVTPSGPGVGQWVGTLALFGTGGSLLVTGSGGSLNISGNILLSWNNDTVLLRGGAANLQLGAADAAAPVAQTLSVQSVVAGTTNTAGAAFTIDGSQGTGTGIGGDIVFRTAPAGSVSGSSVNPLSTAMIVSSAVGGGVGIGGQHFASERLTVTSRSNINVNCATFRNSSTTAKFQFYLNSAGNSELYLGANTLISEVGSSYFNGGNVGIGTTAPTANLVVTNSLGTGYTGTKVNIYGSVQAGGTFVDSIGNTIMASTLSVGGNGGGLDPTFNVYTGTNNSRFLVTAGGNVGIGTTAPGSALHISGALGSNTTTYDSAAALKLTNTTGNSSWLLTSGVIGVVNASFSIRQEGVSLPSFVISNLGNVGIGTTAPTTPLTIQANIGGNGFNILGSAGNFLFQSGGIFGASLLSQSNTSTNGFLLGTDAGASNIGAMLRLQTKGVTRAVIDYLGNVGIGTTSPTSKLHVAETWNAAGTTFAAAKIVVTDTASAAASNLLELWSGSTPALKSYVAKSGSFVGGFSGANQPSALSFPNSGSYSVGVYNPDSYKIQFSMSSAGPGSIAAGAYTGLQYEMTGGILSWGLTNQDIVLARDSQNTLALRNGAGVPQAFRVYNTFLGTTANEWFEIDWKTTAGLLKIGTTSGGTGVGRPIELNASGNYINFNIGTVVKFAVVSNRNLSYQSIEFNSDNTHDIGASGANRPRNVYVAGAVLSGGMQLAPGGAIQNTAGTGAYFNITSGASRLRFDLGGGVVWNDSVNNPLGTETVGLMRNATGVLEVNSGTLGAFRDVRCRSVIQQLPITTTITPASNGDLVIEATSNTTLTFKLKGTDGTVRTGTITLA